MVDLNMSRAKPSRTLDGLTLAERIFVKSYIATNGDGAASAKAAGYAGDLARRSSDLLKRERVWRAIQQSARCVLSPLEVKAERVLYETTHIAFADARKLFHTDNSLLNPSLWPEEIARAISGFEFNKEGSISKIRLYSKLGALEMLGRYLSLWEGKGDKTPDRWDEVVEALRESPKLPLPETVQ
jgi:Terminase small subunit